MMKCTAEVAIATVCALCEYDICSYCYIILIIVVVHNKMIQIKSGSVSENYGEQFNIVWSGK
jgi:hypothetical protein